MFLGFDPLYFLLLAPGMLLAMWAQARVQSAFREGSQIGSRAGVTGAQAAELVLRSGNVLDVGIEPVHGHLSDHYDPRHKVLRLSEGVYASRSLAALGVAAHEAGHAIQDARNYSPLVIRNFLVPAASFGSNAAFLIFSVGLMLSWMRSAFGPILMVGGMILFSAVVLFQLVNLPVEFDASRRAREQLQATGLISYDEEATVKHVLDAAAWTYVAGTLTSILTLFYFLIRSGVLGGRSDD